MLRDQYLKRVMVTHVIVNLIFIISFAIASIYSWTLLVGFVVGSAVTTLSFLSNAFTAKVLLSRKRSKKVATILGIVRLFFQLSWNILWVLLIILFDSIAGGFAFGAGGTNSLVYPIHFITYLVGVSTIAISIIASQIPIRKKKGDVNGQVS